MLYDVIIIGSGPSGLKAANQFEKAKINYLLLEKNDQFGKKLLLSGGRRCNVTNNLSVSDFIDHLNLANRKFLYPALNRFGPREIIDFFKSKSLELILEDNFKYFPKTQKSKSVLNALSKSLDPLRIKFNQPVKKINKLKSHFEVLTKTKTFKGKNVIIASGSNSFPSTGSSGDGLAFARDFKIKYSEFSPAETYIYSKQVVDHFKDLQGQSLKDCEIKIKNLNQSFTGDLLFTHIGLSGPVIFHMSEFIYQDLIMNKESILEIALIKKTQEELYKYLLNNQDQYIDKALELFLNKKIVKRILEKALIQFKKIAEMKKNDLLKVSQLFTAYQVGVDKVEDKEKAYVNKGGIDLKSINPNTMEVKAVSGLYFTGEVLDLHGPIGGYNITIALSTAYTSSVHIINKLSKERDLKTQL